MWSKIKNANQIWVINAYWWIAFTDVSRLIIMTQTFVEGCLFKTLRKKTSKKMTLCTTGYSDKQIWRVALKRAAKSTLGM